MCFANNISWDFLWQWFAKAVIQKVSDFNHANCSIIICLLRTMPNESAKDMLSQYFSCDAEHMLVIALADDYSYRFTSCFTSPIFCVTCNLSVGNAIHSFCSCSKQTVLPVLYRRSCWVLLDEKVIGKLYSIRWDCYTISPMKCRYIIRLKTAIILDKLNRLASFVPTAET